MVADAGTIDVWDRQGQYLWRVSEKAEQETRLGQTKVLVGESDRRQGKDRIPVWVSFSARVGVKIKNANKDTVTRKPCWTSG